MKNHPDEAMAQQVPAAPGGVSRRFFLRSLGTTAVTAAALGADSVSKGLAQANAERPQGPGAVSVALTVNGVKKTFLIEPRTTLLEALRSGEAGLTGAKEACDRATCGACTVLVNDTPVYACSMLAIEAQGAEITTIEGIARDGKLSALQQAMVDKDGLQCGFCSPGMVMVLTALLRKNPHPTEAEVRKAISGNLCRCGSYPRIFAATRAASGQKPLTSLNVIPLHDHAVA
ncbi:MAG: (2Fe-2S)-binding protein [Verrucomicrobia bacterium]|nr:(2Fe-2S)-binding protein [Verrucomicrobiota bacterium]